MDEELGIVSSIVHLDLSFNKVPLVFGVTGHRDPLSVDVANLTMGVERVMNDFRNQFPHTPFLILSSLASGADQIVAECALLTPNTQLIAVLPGGVESFLKSLQTSGEQEVFTKLKNCAIKTIYTSGSGATTMEPQETECLQPEQYQACSHFVARNCHVLLAAWDGRPPTQIGGTADTVHFKLRPQTHVNSTLDDLFAFETEPGLVIHIPIRRASLNNNDSSLTDFTPTIDLQLKFSTTSLQFQPYTTAVLTTDDIPNQTERLNEALSAFTKSQDVTGINNFTDFLQAFADIKANGLRKTYSRFVITILFLGFGAITLIDFRTVVSSRWLTAVAICALLIAFLLWFYLNKRNVQVQYQQYRALSEGARVQSVWQQVGVNRSTSTYYLINHDETTDWIRRTLRTSWLLDIGANHRPSLHASKELMKWFVDQIHYFAGTRRRGAISRAQTKARRLSVIAGTLVLIAAIGLVVNFASELLLLNKSDVSAAGLLTWSVALPIALGLASYSELMGFRSTSKRYTLSLARFENAKDALMYQENGAPEKQQIDDLAIAVGQQALQETSDWLLALQSKKIRPIQ